MSPPRSSAWTSIAASPPCAPSRTADDLVDELIDRYGEPPRTVNNLISVALLRTEAAQAGITDIDQKNGSLLLTIPEFDLRLVSQLCGGSGIRGGCCSPPGRSPICPCA